MEKYKVYQVQKGIYNRIPKSFVIAEYSINGEFEKSDLIADEIWDSCNVECWNNEWEDGDDVIKKNTTLCPTKHFQGYCNSDVIIETPGGIYLAESIGWKVVSSVDEGIQIINENEEIRVRALYDEYKV